MPKAGSPKQPQRSSNARRRSVEPERGRVRYQETNQLPNQLRVPVVRIQHTAAGKCVVTSLDWTSTLALGILRDVEPTIIFADWCMIKNGTAQARAQLRIAIDVAEVGAAIGVRRREGLPFRVAQH